MCVNYRGKKNPKNTQEARCSVTNTTTTTTATTNTTNNIMKQMKVNNVTIAVINDFNDILRLECHSTKPQLLLLLQMIIIKKWKIMTTNAVAKQRTNLAWERQDAKIGRKHSSMAISGDEER